MGCENGKAYFACCYCHLRSLASTIMIEPEMRDEANRVQVRIDYIGQSQQPMVVIDNFMQDASCWVRSAAGGLSYRAISEFYPGVRSPALPLRSQRGNRL